VQSKKFVEIDRGELRNEGVSKSGKCLLIGSTKAYSGKTAIALGIAHGLQEEGFILGYGKPLETNFREGQKDTTPTDVSFVTKMLKLSESQIRQTLLLLDEGTLHKHLRGEDRTNYPQSLQQYCAKEGEDFVILEGPATLEEGSLFDLSLPQMADTLKASVLLVVRPIDLFVDDILGAKRILRDRLLGVIINDVPSEQVEFVSTTVSPFLESQEIPVLGVLPRSALLRSVSVNELVHRLKAEVLCRPDRLDLMVESLAIGAMNVSSAMKYFRKSRNMAVITGGDRTDIQLAALESSTQCLILTGHLPPSPLVLSRAEEVEIPILSVDLDTRTTVEVVDSTFGQVYIHEPIKVQSMMQLMVEHFDRSRFLSLIKG